MADLHVKNNGWNFKFTQYEDDIINKYYPVGRYQLVQDYLPHRTKGAIQARASKLGVRYLTYNKDYFEKIDSPDKAYWLGFIYADGYVTSQNRWGIELNIIDKSHLEKLSKALDANLKIKERKKESFCKEVHSCYFLLNNSKMYKDLFDKGVTRTKTQTITFPCDEIVPKELKLHFLRGLFDGDGTISISTISTGYIKPYIGLVSANEDFLIDIQKFLSNYNINLNLAKKDKSNYFCLRSEKQTVVIDLINLLYKDTSSDIRLDRKYNKALEIIEVFNYGRL